MSQATIPDLPPEGTANASFLIEISKDPGSFSMTLGTLFQLYQDVSDKNLAGGYAGLDSSVLLDFDQFADPVSQAGFRVLALNSGFTATVWVDLPSSGITSINSDTGPAITIVEGVGIDVFTAANTVTISLDAILNNLDDVNISTPVTGNIIYRDALGEWVALATGTNGEFLTLASGIPDWASNTFPINDLTDVSAATPSTNDLLEFTGSNWESRQGVFTGITGLGTQTIGLNMGSQSIIDTGFLQFDTANPADGGKIRFSDKSGIFWRNSTNNGNHSIAFDTDILNISFDNIEQYFFTDDDLQLTDNNLVLDGGFIDIDRILLPSSPTGFVGRLFVMLDPSTGVSELFFLRSTGISTNITKPLISLSLGNLSDVSIIGTETTGQVLLFDGLTGFWNNTTITNEISSSTITPGSFTVNDNVIDDANLITGIFGSIQGLGTQTQNLNMGTANSIVSITSLESASTPLPDTGFIQLARTDEINWRNFLNNADLILTVDANNKLTFDGVILGPGEVFTWTNNHDTDGFSLIDASFADPTDTSMKITIDLSNNTVTNTNLNIRTKQSTGPNASIDIPDIPNSGVDEFVTRDASQVIINKELTTPLLDEPDIDDFTDAQHDHSNVVNGGNIPITSITNNSTIVLTNRTAGNTYTAGKQTFKVVGGASGHAAINVGDTVTDPDVTQLDDGDIWYNAATNQLFARVNSTTIDLVGQELTWTDSRDANNNNLTDIGFLTFADANVIKIQQNSNTLDITVVDDIANAGVSVKNSDGSVTITNANGTLGFFQPTITMTSQGLTSAISMQNIFLIPITDDVSSTVPALVWDIERVGGGAIVNRPIWQLNSGTVEYFTLDSDAKWTFNAGTAFVDLAQIIFNAVTTTTFPADTLIALTEGDYITWDGTSVSTPNSIRFSTTDVFEIANLNAIEYTFSVTQFDLKDNNIVGTTNYGFGSNSTTTTIITANGDGILLEIDNAEFLDIQIDSSLVYRFGQTLADFNGNIIQNIPQINDANGNEVLTFSTILAAINNIQIANVASGGPSISAVGSDTNIDLNLFPKGTGVVNFGGFPLENTPQINDADGDTLLDFVTNPGAAVNFIRITNGVTGTGPALVSEGSDPNIDLNFATMGAGQITFIDDANFNGNKASNIGKLKLDAASNEQISSGSIPYSASYIIVQSENPGSDDTLTDITGGANGDILFIRPEDEDDDIIVSQGGSPGSQIFTPGTFDTLNSIDSVMMLIYSGESDGGTGAWLMVSSENN